MQISAVQRLLIAGFTGRSTADVHAHIAELSRAGVPTPGQVPAIYEVPPSLLTTDDEISVDGANTSGEIEPVVVRWHGEWFLCVGSDHTDRDIEMTSIEESKRGCPKVIGHDCLAVQYVPDWDRLELRSWVDGINDPYQEGELASLLPLSQILDSVAEAAGPLRDGDVVFLGTIPVRDGEMVASAAFRGELGIAGTELVLSLSYRVRQRGGSAA